MTIDILNIINEKCTNNINGFNLNIDINNNGIVVKTRWSPHEHESMKKHCTNWINSRVEQSLKNAYISAFQKWKDETDQNLTMPHIYDENVLNMIKKHKEIINEVLNLLKY